MSLDLELLCHLYGVNPVGAEIRPCVLPDRPSACWCIVPAGEPPEKGICLLGTSIRMIREGAIHAALRARRQQIQEDLESLLTKADSLRNMPHGPHFSLAIGADLLTISAMSHRCEIWLALIDQASP